MKNIYESRSRYVHSGQEVEMSVLESLKPILDEILSCLFRLQRLPCSTDKNVVEKWIKHIDYISAGIEAGKDIQDEDMSSIGCSLADVTPSNLLT